MYTNEVATTEQEEKIINLGKESKKLLTEIESCIGTLMATNSKFMFNASWKSYTNSMLKLNDVGSEIDTIRRNQVT